MTKGGNNKRGVTIKTYKTKTPPRPPLNLFPPGVDSPGQILRGQAVGESQSASIVPSSPFWTVTIAMTRGEAKLTFMGPLLGLETWGARFDAPTRTRAIGKGIAYLHSRLVLVLPFSFRLSRPCSKSTRVVLAQLVQLFSVRLDAFRPGESSVTIRLLSASITCLLLVHL